jgi:phage shock protein PspC (stress-responsive transcriptional regulator)
MKINIFGIVPTLLSIIFILTGVVNFPTVLLMVLFSIEIMVEV